MIGGFWSGGFWSGGYFTDAGQSVPGLGGARHWDERIRKGREATEARIRAAKDDELKQIIRELKAEGIIPEATPEPRKRTAARTPETSARREAELQRLIIQVQVAIGTMERARLQQAREEEDAVALLMLI